MQTNRIVSLDCHLLADPFQFILIRNYSYAKLYKYVNQLATILHDLQYEIKYSFKFNSRLCFRTLSQLFNSATKQTSTADNRIFGYIFSVSPLVSHSHSLSLFLSLFWCWLIDPVYLNIVCDWGVFWIFDINLYAARKSISPYHNENGTSLNNLFEIVSNYFWLKF